MKSAVETLNPTRVRLTIEVPFEELKPSLDAAYKKIAQQVMVPGFRKGKVPPPVIDRRFGRAVVLEEAVNEALPKFYSQAVRDNSIQVLGQPEVDVTEFADGADLKFTAEVDVRPEIELPDYDNLEVTVDDAEVTDEDVAKQLDALRERFAVLTGVDRAVENGDYVSLDLRATIDGEEVEGGTATNVSYEVGSGRMIDGLDEALLGMRAGESKTFRSTLAGGPKAGEEADIEVKVNSVKVKELPELDDEFAQTASEFDTLEELRADTRKRLENIKKYEQVAQARDKVLEKLIELVEVPVPEGVLENELAWRKQNLQQQLQAVGLTQEAWLKSEGKTAEEFAAELEKNATEAIKAQFILDAIAQKEQLSVSEAELSQHIIQRAMQAGVSPDQFAQQVVQAGQVPVLVSEVVRGKALALVVEAAKVSDTSGREVDLKALYRDEATEAEETPTEGQEAEETPAED
ncbi:trigger factor [Carbonactinospora thermoautotrophica]|uniref:Trigger factor n=1 Tax=Carbonactinospora thermoautotrophica TaxID=1469144 RepID=A0A132MQA4_9ACTN|nr:trigger factor [Carbonactinospora thermoautotrophica]KWX00047.1 trigger factor [Carbonactinospora thermoautotrophica]KWX07879.1 trigger factor [Carbonactinospora thermoautotrophica]